MNIIFCFFQDFHMQLLTPSVVAMAVRMLTAI